MSLTPHLDVIREPYRTSIAEQLHAGAEQWLARMAPVGARDTVLETWARRGCHEVAAELAEAGFDAGAIGRLIGDSAVALDWIQAGANPQEAAAAVDTDVRRDDIERLGAGLSLLETLTRFLACDVPGSALTTFLRRGGTQLEHFESLCRVGVRSAKSINELSDAHFQDCALQHRLAQTGISLSNYEVWVECGITDVEDIAALRAAGVTRRLYWAAQRAGARTIAEVVALSQSGKARVGTIWSYAEFGLEYAETVALLNASISASEYREYRRLGYTTLEEILAIHHRGIDAGARLALRELGVTDEADICHLLNEHISVRNLDAWASMAIFHPYAILELQRAGIGPTYVTKNNAEYPEPAHLREQSWAALQSQSCVRIRSGGRLISLVPSREGLVEPHTGLRPDEEGNERALVALNAPKSRLLRVLDAWDAAMSGSEIDTQVLPAKLRAGVGKARSLWLHDRVWYARTKYPGCWDGQRVR